MTQTDAEQARLNEYDANEWFDVVRSFRPDMTREQFDVMWADFQEQKRLRALH
ncbi:hypothetical protein [Paraburkholderia sp. C35]|uniref:hypothetical protein n=1 Tax=Paraburkholderia sp. C35 TaxID=2126993 RepID=UPI0013A57579|nr:hypothetical protein [Paraburkholderia sp. C35]